MKKMINSYKKGRAFEQEIARRLTSLTGIKYARTPLSGGYRMDMPFDIMKRENKPSPLDLVGIEVKDHKNIRMPEWIKQVKGECEDANLGYNAFWVILYNWKGEVFVNMPWGYYEELIKRSEKLEGVDK